MSELDAPGFHPIVPERSEIDPEQVVVRYNEPADTLYVHFYGLGVPAVSVDVNDYLYLRVDRSTRRVVGLQIEAYLNRAVKEDPRWLDLAEMAGIAPDTIDMARQEISRAKKRIAALNTVFDELRLAIA